MQRLRTVIQAALCVGCLVVLSFAAVKGVDKINAYRDTTVRSGILTNTQWRCIERRLQKVVPAGSRVYVDRAAKDVNPAIGTNHESWSLLAVSLPDRTLVPTPEPGAYQLSLRRVAGTPARPGDCPTVRLVAQVIP